MTEKELPNLFLILEIDPNQPWRPLDFEKQLETRRREWARLVNRPDKKGLEAKKNLGQIAELKRIAADESLRQEQAAAARQQSLNRRAEALQKLDEDIQLKELRGYMLQEEFDNLLAQHKAHLSEAELRKRIQVPIRKEPPASSAPQQAALDGVTANEIENLLQQLKKKDLFEFLGLSEATSSGALHEKAKDLYDQVGRKGAKTAEDTFVSQLSGHCLEIFKDSQKRALYTETLRRKDFEELKAMADVAAQVTKEITSAQLEQILVAARSKKLDPNEALAVIKKQASTKKYALIITESLVETVAKMLRCGNCGRMNEADKNHCAGCGRPLKETCPGCGQAVLSDEHACGNCGFAVGDRFYASYLVGEAGQAALDREYEAASRWLAQAHSAWPADAKDGLVQKITALEEQVNLGRRQQDEALAAIRTPIRGKRYFEARGLLPALQKALPARGSQYTEMLRLVEGEIQKAEDRLAQAREVAGRGSLDDAILLYQEALAFCRDCPDALQMLQRIPPEPPQNLKATVSGGLVQLSWSASPSKQISYSVVRKAGARPSSGTDGTQVKTVAGLEFDDTSCEPGLACFYAVYASREGVLSTRAALLSSPVLVLQEVSGLSASVQDRQVRLQWIPPLNAVDVIVVRSENGAPRSIGEGRRVALLDKTQAVDLNLANNHSYFYTVFAQFRGISDAAVLSAGVSIEAVPQAPPQPVSAFQITPVEDGRQHRLQLSWKPVDKGMVMILKAAKPTGLAEGTVIPRADLGKYGRLLTPQGDQLLDELEGRGYTYYLPVVLFQESAYIGKEQPYIDVEDVREFTVQRLGFALRLQWRWPETCQEVLIATGTSGWASRENADALVRLTRAQYEIGGSYDLLNPPQVDHYLTVFALYGQGQEQVCALGARRLVRLNSRILLEYELKKTRFQRSYVLEVRTSGKGALPALLLVRKRSALPLQRLDGEMIQRIEARTLEKEKDRFRVELEPSAASPYAYARLFLEDDSLYEDVTIRHPEREKMRLF